MQRQKQHSQQGRRQGMLRRQAQLQRRQQQAIGQRWEPNVQLQRLRVLGQVEHVWAPSTTMTW